MMRNVDESILRAYTHGNMQVLRQHIYEYQKGLRDLILHTTSSYLEDDVIRLLDKKDVSYMIQRASDNKINVFFGDRKCINILRKIGDKRLSDYTDEEDFILGIMLGYDRLQQCDRYLKRKNKSMKIELLA
jgi:Mg2+/Co2+ transporter CorC